MDGRSLYLCYFVGFLFWSQQLPLVRCDNQRKLVMLNAVYRHGDRSPTHIYPNDPYQEDVWPQGLGMLTQSKGMRGEYALGKFLKKRYVKGYKLLNATYLHREIYIRSTDIERTLMSAQTQLNGLYPPKGHQIWRDKLDWQPIGSPRASSCFMYSCPRFFKLQAEGKKQPGYIKMTLQYKDLLEYVSTNSGQEVDVSTMFQIRDPLYVRNPTKEKKQNPEQHRQEPGTGKSICIQQHDTTISAFMSALGVFDGISPDYSSAVMVELFQSGEGLEVHVMYRFGQRKPHALILPGCEEFCPMAEFIRLTHDVIPEDIVKECAIEQEELYLR
ncbi:testicular acid phosphatase homolog [Acropora millepora]|uniref:testicular acid phosphatase homolog n=1 Tax=Acropora millepora TaxID=45264 RepID=UPI001CF4AB5F|nr:testicular acid phosphatase homolog [Acropora millepora]